MDFGLTDRHRCLIESVRSFVETSMSARDVTEWERDGGVPDEIARDIVNLDYCGFNVVSCPEGGSYDVFAQMLVLEEFASASLATLPTQNDFINLQVMKQFADPEQFRFQRESYEETGRLPFALAFSEPNAGSDSMNMSTAVRMVAGRLMMMGAKTFVNNGEYAPYLLVAALDESQQRSTVNHAPLSLWLVPRSLEGVYAYPIEKIGQMMLPFADVAFDGVVLDESHRLVGKHPGFPQLFHLFERARLFSCATALGLAQGALRLATARASSRIAFGVPIARFSQIQEKLMEMEIRVVNMRNFVYGAARSLQSGKGHRLDVALMKRYVPKAATEVASEALQIFGGRGYTRQERVSAIWEDCRGFQIAVGTDEVMTHVAGPLVLEKYGQQPVRTI